MDNLVSVSLRERGGRFHAVFYDPDRGQKWRTLRTSDRREANKRIRIAEDLVSRGDFDPWESPIPDRYATLRGAADLYLAEREKGQLSRNTIRSDRSALGGLCSHMGPAAKVRAVTSDRVKLYFRELIDDECADSTLRTYHTRFKHFFEWCRRERLVRRNPLDGVPRPAVSDALPRFLSHAEFDALVGAVYSDAEAKARGVVDGERSKHTSLHDGDIVWLAEVFFVAVETGLRRGELCAMEWSWVDMASRSIWVPANRRTYSDKDSFGPKSRRSRRVPFGAGSGTEAVLQRLHDETGGKSGPVFVGQRGGPLDGDYVSKRFKEYAGQAGLSEDYVFHTLRHTCASWLVMAGRHLVEVKEILGHASIDTTVRWYAHLDPTRLNAAADATFGRNGDRLRQARRGGR